MILREQFFFIFLFFPSLLLLLLFLSLSRLCCFFLFIIIIILFFASTTTARELYSSKLFNEFVDRDEFSPLFFFCFTLQKISLTNWAFCEAYIYSSHIPALMIFTFFLNKNITCQHCEYNKKKYNNLCLSQEVSSRVYITQIVICLFDIQVCWRVRSRLRGRALCDGCEAFTPRLPAEWEPVQTAAAAVTSHSRTAKLLSDCPSATARASGRTNPLV